MEFKKVFVTGGTGFVGSKVVNACRSTGWGGLFVFDRNRPNGASQKLLDGR